MRLPSIALALSLLSSSAFAAGMIDAKVREAAQAIPAGESGEVELGPNAVLHVSADRSLTVRKSWETKGTRHFASRSELANGKLIWSHTAQGIKSGDDTTLIGGSLGLSRTRSPGSYAKAQARAARAAAKGR